MTGPSEMNKILLLSACLAFLAGCLGDGSIGAPGAGGDQGLNDDDLRAGATSTTNWPPELGSRAIGIGSLADSVLTIAFRIQGEAASDTLPSPVRLSGRASLYKAGIISALEAPRFAFLDFRDADTLRIRASSAASLLDPGEDTLFFNVRIETDSLGAWAFGYGYLRITGRFFQTAVSKQAENSIHLRGTDAVFAGRLDTAGAFPESAASGESILLLCIPGTHFHRRLLDDSIEAGPLPRGEYPLRFLRVTRSTSGVPETTLEIFVAAMTRMNAESNFFRFRPGELIRSHRLRGEVMLRSEPPP